MTCREKHGLRRPDIPSVPPRITGIQEISIVITALGSASEDSETPDGAAAAVLMEPEGSEGTGRERLDFP